MNNSCSQSRSPSFIADSVCLAVKMKVDFLPALDNWCYFLVLTSAIEKCRAKHIISFITFHIGNQSKRDSSVAKLLNSFRVQSWFSFRGQQNVEQCSKVKVQGCVTLRTKAFIITRRKGKVRLLTSFVFQPIMGFGCVPDAAYQ